jgi:hypothetical protein
MPRSADVDQLAREIGSQLSALSSRTAEGMRAIRRQYSEGLAKAAPGPVIRLALRLIARPDIFCRIFAYELLNHHKPALASLTPDHVQKLGRGIDSWGAVDCFAGYVAGPVWRDGRLPGAMIRDWTRSPDRWWRRAALVSTVPLSRRGRPEDVRRTGATCAALLSDRDDMVVKALSWVLRQPARDSSGCNSPVPGGPPERVGSRGRSLS